MSSNDKDLMGYDPLEWLKEESESPPPEAPVEPPETHDADAVAESPIDTSPVSEEAPAEPVAEEPVETPDEVSTDTALDLETSLQIMDVAILKPRLEESLSKLKEITLRADQDITVDGAGMQLLLAFVQQAQANEIKLQWEELPAPIAEAAKLLNTKQVLLRD